MSRNFAVIEKSASASFASAEKRVEPAQQNSAVSHPGYADLIGRLFHSRSVVAVMGGDLSDVCEDIASELAESGKRVVVVAAQKLLTMGPLAPPCEPVLMPGSGQNGSAQSIWHWPSPLNRQTPQQAHVEFFRSSPSVEPGSAKWLDILRQTFDAVLLNFPPLDTQTPAAADDSAEIARMADAAVLVVEAGRTPKQQIQRDQCALQSKNVKLAGCILVQKR